MLHDELKKLNRYPFHMPGHKRNESFEIIGSDIDITEIDGFDNLHSPLGLIKDIEGELSELYRAEKSFMLINGSTVGIIASVFAVSNEGDTILIARNCHQSVYNACFLRKLKAVFIEPEFNAENGFYAEVTQMAVDEAVKRHPNACAVVITSPTYEGYISDIKTDLPLIVDCAHGAHLGFGGFPKYPAADIAVSSLHKTLPALTQTAVLNVYNKKYISEIKRYLDIFETSSPSYVLMNSVSKCAQFLKNGKLQFEEYEKLLAEFRRISLKHLELLNTDDKGKLVISCAKSDISSAELAEILRNKYFIEPEMVSASYIILMTSPADTKEAFDMLKKALCEIDEKLSVRKNELFFKPATEGGEIIIEFPIKTEKTKLTDAAGKRSGEYVYAYPPDIPLLFPNQIITEEAIESITLMLSLRINIISESNLLPDFILTKAD